MPMAMTQACSASATADLMRWSSLTDQHHLSSRGSTASVQSRLGPDETLPPRKTFRCPPLHATAPYEWHLPHPLWDANSNTVCSHASAVQQFQDSMVTDLNTGAP
jgi:hypothetical protein